MEMRRLRGRRRSEGRSVGQRTRSVGREGLGAREGPHLKGPARVLYTLKTCGDPERNSRKLRGAYGGVLGARDHQSRCCSTMGVDDKWRLVCHDAPLRERFHCRRSMSSALEQARLQKRADPIAERSIPKRTMRRRTR